MSISCLWYCTWVLQDVTIEGKLEKGYYYSLQLHANRFQWKNPAKPSVLMISGFILEHQVSLQQWVSYRKTSYDEAVAALWKSWDKTKSNTLPLNGVWGSSRLGGDQANLTANSHFMWWRPPLRSFPQKRARWEPDLLTVQDNPEIWVFMWNFPNFLLNTANIKPNSSEGRVATCIFPSHPHQQPSWVGLDLCFPNGVKQGGPLIGESSAALTGRSCRFCWPSTCVCSAKANLRTLQRNLSGSLDTESAPYFLVHVLSWHGPVGESFLFNTCHPCHL